MRKKRKVVGAALSPCVHVGGLDHFLRLCEELGWNAVSLGPDVSMSTLFNAIRGEHPDMVAVSYRLTAEDALPIFAQIKEQAVLLDPPVRWVFGGTPPVANAARDSGLFERAFDGTEAPGSVEAFLLGRSMHGGAEVYPDDLVSRVEWAAPFPLIRHHYGEPSLAATIAGAARIAESGALDVLSIGPDQNAQEHFFRPGEMDPTQDGAGGVPVRCSEDLAILYEATRCGNFPLLRCYSGTRDLIPWAEMSLKHIRNAWGAIPLCWYSVMDGRSTVPFPRAIEEKQAAMRFYAERGVPVEVNESHQWSLRDAHDSLAVAMAFLAAYNAKAMGVRHYIVQMMHNTPPSTSPAMDLAKMLAKLELISEIESPEFAILREVRAGIASLPSHPERAKGHIAASATYSMALEPHILHVVGFTEGWHVVDAEALIESCNIARGAIHLALQGAPDMRQDPTVRERQKHLVCEARVLLAAIRDLGEGAPDPWATPSVLSEAIRRGILDAPHFRGNPYLCGRAVTACLDGGWEAIDPVTRRPLSESARLASLGVPGGGD